MSIDGVLLTPLRKVEHPKGEIYHAMKASAPGFCGFGEAYFSTVRGGLVKGWKRHNRLTLNLVVIVGAIRFVIRDDRADSPTRGQVQEVVLGPAADYARLTVPPGLWVAFQGVDAWNLLLNIIAQEHDPAEADNLALDTFAHAWPYVPTAS